MTLWFLILLLSGISFVALFFAGRRQIGVDNSQQNIEKTEAHFKLQLQEIDADQKSGKLADAEAEAARAELARELLRHRQADSTIEKSTENSWLSLVLTGASIAVVIAAVGIYSMLGMPDQSTLVRLDAQNQVASQEQLQNEENFARLLEQVEAQLVADPSDVKGWRVLAPAYMRATRYQDAVRAYRKILELAPPDAETLTDLAEAVLLASDVTDNSEVISLLKTAADLDKTHVRSRFYLAAENTRTGNWDDAIAGWNEVLGLGTEQDPWYNSARDGLAIAMARGGPPQQVAPQEATPQETTPPALNPDQQQLVNSMVAGLDERLNQDGGTIEEWTRLVQSYVVLGDKEKAQQSYQSALEEYPDASGREKLDALAQRANLSKATE